MLKVTLLLCLVVGTLAVEVFERQDAASDHAPLDRAKRQFGFSGSGANAQASSFGSGFGGGGFPGGFGGGFSGSQANAGAGSFGAGFGR